MLLYPCHKHWTIWKSLLTLQTVSYDVRTNFYFITQCNRRYTESLSCCFFHFRPLLVLFILIIRVRAAHNIYLIRAIVIGCLILNYSSVSITSLFRHFSSSKKLQWRTDRHACKSIRWSGIDIFYKDFS